MHSSKLETSWDRNIIPKSNDYPKEECEYNILLSSVGYSKNENSDFFLLGCKIMYSIFCRLEPIHKENEHLIFRFRFSATLIAGSSNHSSFSAFANPPNSYIQISKKHENASGWVAIYRSSRVDDSSTPTWDVGEVNMASLCNGDWDRPLRLVVMQHHRKAQDVVLGECETTLRMILNTQRDTHSTRSENEVSTHGFCLQRNMSNPNPKPSGRLQVKLAQVIDTLHNNEISSTSMFSSTCSLDDASDDGTWKDHHVVNIAAIPTPITSRATFQDYIQSGWMLNPFVAIDFTSSNGDPRIPGTLHYQNPITFNDYEETIVSIGTAIAPYTEGGASVTTVWGFGSKFDGELRHIFQCGPQPRVSGVDGILDAYRSVLAAGLTMSGPTCLDKVLRAAGSTARKHQESNVRLYSVLLIITDGICQNLEETKRLLSVYHSEPLSIIIVGVGRADFGELRELESFPKVTVCEFRKHQHDPRSLGRSALERLPTQFVEYMIEKEMSP